MQQRFRRQLLAIGGRDGNRDQEFATFLQSVMAAEREDRPTSEGVLDVLLASRLTHADATAFADHFEEAVWGATSPIPDPRLRDPGGS